MHYFKLTGNWSQIKSEFMGNIPAQLKNDVAILYNSSPDIDAIYFATTNSLLASKIQEGYDVEILEDIDYSSGLMLDSNRQWGVIGNGALVNF